MFARPCQNVIKIPALLYGHEIGFRDIGHSDPVVGEHRDVTMAHECNSQVIDAMVCKSQPEVEASVFSCDRKVTLTHPDESSSRARYMEWDSDLCR